MFSGLQTCILSPFIALLPVFFVLESPCLCKTISDEFLIMAKFERTCLLYLEPKTKRSFRSCGSFPKIAFLVTLASIYGVEIKIPNSHGHGYGYRDS
jgi:hypothetical protein